MLENERYDLSILRDELRETAEVAERLERVLTHIEILLPRADGTRPQKSGEGNTKGAPRS